MTSTPVVDGKLLPHFSDMNQGEIKDIVNMDPVSVTSRNIFKDDLLHTGVYFITGTEHISGLQDGKQRFLVKVGMAKQLKHSHI